MRLSVVSFAGLIAVSSAALVSQDRPDRPTFRTGVELVQLDVVVLDSKRQPVSGLSASDFTVLDDGTPAAIRAFTPVELARSGPSDAVWAGELEPDVATNRVADDEGRLVVILMDRSIPPDGPVVKARQIAKAAIDALGPLDLAAIVSTNNNAVQSGLVQSLTADRTRLKRTIDGGDPSTGISAEAEGLMNRDGFQMNAMNDTRCPCSACVLETMTRVAEAVQNAQRRRKLLLFVGSNVIWQTYQPASAGANNIGCEGRLKDARNAMFAAVDRANLTIHSIDPQGMVNDSPQAHATPRTGPPRSAIDKLQSGLAASMRERENLTVLPERTGGRTVVGRNDPEASLPDILRESETYYVIGIERALSKRADATRRIEVKVGRKGLRVVAPREYIGIGPQSPSVASVARRDAPAPSPMDEALARLLPNSTLPLALSLTTFAPDKAGNPVVRVNIDAGAFAEGDGTNVPLDVAVIALDPGGRIVASARQRSTIAVKRAGSGPPAEVNVQSQLELEPGNYDVRVAVSVADRVASVFSNLTVVPFADAPVSLSSVNVEAALPARAPVPTTRRTFKRNENVLAVFQIYQGTQRTDALAPVSMRVRIFDAKGTAVRDQSLPFAETAFTNRRTDAVITLPLAKLAPGDYLLKLDAAMGRHTSGRALRFAVE